MKTALFEGGGEDRAQNFVDHIFVTINLRGSAFKSTSSVPPENDLENLGLPEILSGKTREKKPT